MVNPDVSSNVIGKAGSAVLLIAIFTAIPFLGTVCAAEGGFWTVSTFKGTVTIDGRPATTAGAQLGPGTVIGTAADGNAVLSRPGDSITIYPNSRMTVPDAGGDAEPGILQTLGKLLFRMESRESRDFEIRTPYLAAAIKGTTFTVYVAETEAEVDVLEGSVLVTANRSGHAQYVGPGQRAVVGGGRGDSVKMLGESGGDHEGGNNDGNDDESDHDSDDDRSETSIGSDDGAVDGESGKDD